MRKIFFLFFIFALAITGCVQTGNQGGTPGLTLTLSTKELNDFLKKEFPVEKKYKFVHVRLDNPDVLNIQKDRIKIGSDVIYSVEMLPEVKGKVLISGGIKYDPEKRAIYLKDPVIEKLEFFRKNLVSFIPENHRKTLFGFIGEVFSTVPVYRFDNKKLMYRFLKDIKAEDGKLVLRFGL